MPAGLAQSVVTALRAREPLRTGRGRKKWGGHSPAPPAPSIPHHRILSSSQTVSCQAQEFSPGILDSLLPGVSWNRFPATAFLSFGLFSCEAFWKPLNYPGLGPQPCPSLPLPSLSHAREEGRQGPWQAMLRAQLCLLPYPRLPASP